MLNFPTDKRGQILRAAFEVFIAYGFRKTSMDDIARTAGMSRPALYQSFRNKTDIFRELSRQMAGHACENARHAMDGDGAFSSRLFRAIDTSILEMHRIIDETPHGIELLGINEEIARDLEDECINTLRAIIADGLKRADQAGEVDLSIMGGDAEKIAKIFMSAMEGTKRDYLRGHPVTDTVADIVTFFSNAIAPGAGAMSRAS